jgi:dUTPase
LLQIHSLKSFVLNDKERRFVSTGIKVETPFNYIGRLVPFINDIRLMDDMVGRDEIFIDLCNTSGVDVAIMAGQPIAYFVIEQRNSIEPIFDSNLKSQQPMNLFDKHQKEISDQCNVQIF